MYRVLALVRRALPLVLLLALFAAAPWGGQSASATTTANGRWSVALVSLGDDYVTQGHDFFFRAANATISVQGTQILDVLVQQSDTVWFDLQFGAAPGQDLQPGDYVHASSYNPTGSPEPYINVAAEGHGGNTSGRFQIREISTDPSGNVTRLWLTFQADGWILGEIRINVPSNGAVVGPRNMLWPGREIDAEPLLASVAVWNPGSQPVRFGRATVSGPNAGDDTIVSDGCKGRTLAARRMCHIKLRFEPLAVGQSTATLVVPETGDGAPTHRVSLEGFVRATNTEFTLRSDPGEYIGQGESWDFVPTNAAYSPQIYTDHLLQVDFGGGGDGSNWVATFAVPHGQTFAPGATYQTAAGASLSVSGNERGCKSYSGNFTLNTYELDKWGDIVGFSIDFTQWCGTTSGPGPALHGSLDYQVNAVSIRHTNTQLIVSGQVAAGKRSQIVDVTVMRGIVRIAHKTLKLRRSGVYVLELARRFAKRTCRASVKTPSTSATVASRVTKTDRC